MINFRLKNIEDIKPFAQPPELSLHWFGLTDGYLWLNFGKNTLYEYTDDALNYFGNKTSKYNDYYISRFIEDFSDLFKTIGESLPDKFYDLTSDFNGFQTDVEKWLDNNVSSKDDNEEFYFDKYDTLISWISERNINTGHLVGGPNLYFFRHHDKIKIIWETDYKLENGVDLWTAADGQFEMNYNDFVEKVIEFGTHFFKSMQNNIQLALDMDWKGIILDKKALFEEHRDREMDFFKKIDSLKVESDNKTSWEKIDLIYEQMKKEIT